MTLPLAQSYKAQIWGWVDIALVLTSWNRLGWLSFLAVSTSSLVGVGLTVFIVSTPSLSQLVLGWHSGPYSFYLHVKVLLLPPPAQRSILEASSQTLGWQPTSHHNPCCTLFEYRYPTLPLCFYFTALCNIPRNLSFPSSARECINVFLIPPHFIFTSCSPWTIILLMTPYFTATWPTQNQHHTSLPNSTHDCVGLLSCLSIIAQSPGVI